ncbi:MAG: hypothetical protein GX591_12340 [Planctomycetes bacterium]|nr:hypothetical protein [Planctomycetota bacterium]
MRNRGTAMSEFILALPLLMLILALVWMVGWVHLRKQRVAVAARHAVQMDVEGAAVTDADLRRDGLGRAARSIDARWQGGDTGELGDWVDAVGLAGPSPAALADEAFAQRWPADRGLTLEVRYDPPVAIARTFDNDITVSYRQAGPPWVRGEAPLEPILVGRYCADFDAALAGAGGDGADLAARIRGLIQGEW